MAALLAGALPLGGGMAWATEGYVALGYSAEQRGQGGTGVAQGAANAAAANTNPAAVAGQGKTLTLGLEFFMPDRGYEASGTFFVAPGDFRSGRDFFAIPDVAYSMPLQNGTVLNFSAFGNGGLNTSYDAVANPNCGPANGVYCDGPAGVSLSQVFLSVTWAGRNGPLSWGIAPTLAGQSMTVKGLGAFAGLSSNPGALTGNGADTSTGLGLRAGLQYAVNDSLRLGLSGQTKFEMSKFESYAGLFENGGEFDIPAQVNLGVAFNPTPDVTLLLDYQYIFYSGVPAVSNATNAGPLGAPGGAGFGWDDVGVIKLGAAWRQNDMLTWRAGYAHSDNPIGPEDVTLNVLAPGVVQDHFTIGGSYAPTGTGSLDWAVIYVANNLVSGPETTPMGVSPGSDITIDMDQLAISLGWTYRF